MKKSYKNFNKNTNAFVNYSNSKVSNSKEAKNSKNSCNKINVTKNLKSLTFKEKTNYIHNNAAFWNENIFNDIAVAPNGRVWLASWIPKDYGICYFDTEKQLFVQINNLRHFKTALILLRITTTE